MTKKNTKISINRPQGQAGLEFIGEITGYTHRGQGVTRHDGRVVFVPKALKGEVLQIKIVGKKQGVLTGEVVKIIKASPGRNDEICPAAASCGGCALQHADYAEQKSIKAEIVKNALERIGSLPDIAEKIKPVMGKDVPLAYRGKGIFRLNHNGVRYNLGFMAEGSHSVTDYRCILLFPEQVNRLLSLLENLLNDGYENLAAATDRIMVKTTAFNKELMLIFFIKKRQKTKAVLAVAEKLYGELRAANPNLRVFGYTVDSGEPNPLYTNLTILSRDTVITENLAGTLYEISPASFFQVSPKQAEKMLLYIKDLINNVIEKKENLQIIDAYSGIGTIGLALAGAAESVDCIEIVPQAVSDAEKNCRLNNLKNVRCYCGKAEELFDEVSRSRPAAAARLVIIDPPRKGCHPALLQGILDFAAEYVIYVSCNPSTLGRDLAVLTEKYEVQSVQPIDFFPQSYHVECVTSLKRRG